ncbi:hypothetical protein SAMN04488132_107122 [Sediminibacterium ginsengisoli]|uniref:Uncharacterized protein n=1 Tax=Sediminibacterium ginsengisoli TaxID=413434 RepID=A0A1T4Q2Y1_9BACT|nr:hypothetical protein SAMN04488132_107122 [Sediminibacterium ginsengisoli]
MLVPGIRGENQCREVPGKDYPVECREIVKKDKVTTFITAIVFLITCVLGSFLINTPADRLAIHNRQEDHAKHCMHFLQKTAVKH